MRHNEYACQPSYFPQKGVKLVGADLIALDRLLRISKIMKVLGFAESQKEFAQRFLNMSHVSMDRSIAGHAHQLSSASLRYLKQKLDMVRNTVADEIAAAPNKTQLCASQSRYKLVQTAAIHFDELFRKLS